MARRSFEMKAAHKTKKGKVKRSSKAPWWKSKLRSAKHQAANIFAVIGFITVLILAIRFFAGGG